MARPVTEMRNLGPFMARALSEIGVETEAELRELGPVEAYARMKHLEVPRLSLNALYAMAASLYDVDWRLVSPERKIELRRELERRLRCR
jgi:DNA transformation protein